MTSNERLNSYIRYPDWSPTGEAIYYELAETTGNIWLVDLAQAAEGRASGKGEP